MSRVLLIDDDVALTKMYKTRLEVSGFEVVVCNTVSEVDTVLDGMQFEVTVLDIMMPGMSGLELVKKLKREGGFEQMGKILGFTSLSRDAMVKDLASCDIEECVDKSEIRPSELVEKIKKMLG